MANLSETLSSLSTEQINAQTVNIDTLSSLELVTLMNAQDASVLSAVKQALPQIAKAIDGITARLKQGGRLFYIGAGTSGRLGVLDASECPPTFNVSPELVIGIIAGGDSALRHSSESCEDSITGGKDDLAARGLRGEDAVVAISASGYAPYCRSALEYARSIGALAISLSCNTPAPFSSLADIAIEAPTGPEVLSGSTRLKAGTATKMILNMLSTGTMIRLGKTYQNLMVDVRATNAKLRERALRITVSATGVSREEAAEALNAAGGHVKTAIVMLLCSLSAQEAEQALNAEQGYVRRVLEKNAAGKKE